MREMFPFLFPWCCFALYLNIHFCQLVPICFLSQNFTLSINVLKLFCQLINLKFYSFRYSFGYHSSTPIPASPSLPLLLHRCCYFGTAIRRIVLFLRKLCFTKNRLARRIWISNYGKHVYTVVTKVQVRTVGLNSMLHVFSRNRNAVYSLHSVCAISLLCTWHNDCEQES